MYPTLLDAVTTRSDSRFRSAEQAGAVLFVTVLTAMAAQISVPLPFTPVPFTFQPMVVLVGAAALGSRLGMFSQILYLALGIVDWTPGAGGPGPPADQRVNPAAVIRAASAAGLQLILREDFPPFVFLLVFGRANARSSP